MTLNLLETLTPVTKLLPFQLSNVRELETFEEYTSEWNRWWSSGLIKDKPMRETCTSFPQLDKKYWLLSEWQRHTKVSTHTKTHLSILVLGDR